MKDEIELAVIDANTLACVGLKSLLHDLLPDVVVRCFRSYAELMQDTPFGFVHYFVSSNIYFSQVNFFRQLGHRVVLLVQGPEQARALGVPALDISQDEHSLIQQVLLLRQMGGRSGEGRATESFLGPSFAHVRRHDADALRQPDLSPREIEVLALVVKGFINKEIAEQLHISSTTVITHRKNIQEKTGIHTLSGLTVYAILNEYVRLEEV